MIVGIFINTYAMVRVFLTIENIVREILFTIEVITFPLIILSDPVEAYFLRPVVIKLARLNVLVR